MIQTYLQEIRHRRKTNRIFWLLVFIFTIFLYYFFQGYYININLQKYIKEKNIDRHDIIKQFGIINISVFPSPDKIKINGKNYTNGSKTMFDFGNYKIQINKKGFINMELNININEKNPFYTNSINLIKIPKYTLIKEKFDNVYKVDDFYITKIENDVTIKILNQDMEKSKILVTNYFYLGNKFFSYNDNIYVYDFDDNILKPLISKESGNIIICKKTQIFNENLFCFDTMAFLSGNYIDTKEKIEKIGKDIILTKNYIYNNNQDNNNWDYYKHENKFLLNPTSLIHLENIPFVLDGGFLYNLEKTKKDTFKIDLIDEIISAKEFGQEVILLGYKNKKQVFILINGNRIYKGVFNDNTDIKNIEIYKINGTYIFKTNNYLYMYYKGGKNILKMID
ncbi:hypothetical protein KAZ01_02095, partial [Candidatus Gracilibacteria bacterium]|nr:hypothetical protein [Candidatus Gracilibacteria bacterium]